MIEFLQQRGRPLGQRLDPSKDSLLPRDHVMVDGDHVGYRDHAEGSPVVCFVPISEANRSRITAAVFNQFGCACEVKAPERSLWESFTDVW